MTRSPISGRPTCSPKPTTCTSHARSLTTSPQPSGWQWRVVAPTKVGGGAYGDPGQEFVPGRYIRLWLHVARLPPALLVQLGMEA
jgi:hypothetical protein